VSLLLVRFSSVTGLVLVVPPGLMAGVLALTVAMCVAASIVSVRKALQVDPLVVFRA
jgi:putative ABC transport system permease protein